MLAGVVVTRTCIGCRQRDDKSGLERFVRGSTGELVWDAAADMPGRGAYLHHNQACWQAAVKRRAFGRALRGSVSAASPPPGWGVDLT